MKNKIKAIFADSKLLYKILVETSPEAIAIHDLEGRIIEVSPQWLKMWDYDSTEEVADKSGFEFIAADYQDKAKKTFQELIKKGWVRNIEIAMLRKDGSRFIGELNGTIIKDSKAIAKAIMVTTRDITEQKRVEQELKKYHKHLEELIKERTKNLNNTNRQLEMELKERKKVEQALRESEMMYRMLIETSPEAVGLHGLLDDKVIEVSQQWLKLWGYDSVEEVVGRNNIEFIAPEDHGKVEISRQKGYKERSLRNLEITCLRKDGTRFVGEMNTTIIRDADGKFKIFIATTRDITERKRMEDALRHSKKLLQQEVKTLQRKVEQKEHQPKIIGNSPKIIHVIDLVQQIARTNSTVLIYGETGSGKDLIAMAIHSNSNRKDKLFLSINCAALPEQLIESELFGYAKGAFTGATQDKKGFLRKPTKAQYF